MALYKNNWGELLKLQDQYSKQQDLRKKQQSNYYKQLYKQQLQQLINEQKNKNKYEKIQQKKIIDIGIERQKVIFWCNKDQTIVAKQQLERKKWDNLRHKFSRDNYQSSLEKRKLEKYDQIHQNNLLSQKYKRLSTQIHSEKEHQKRSYSLKQYQLAAAYQKQMEEENRKRYFSREQDKKIQEMAKKIQQEKQRQRINQLNKIKFGYGQNHKVFQLSKQAYESKVRQRNQFINSLSGSKKQFETINTQPAAETSKSRLLRQISAYNRQQFEDKLIKKKINLKIQTFQESKKLENLRKALEQQRNYKSIQKQKQKRQLKSELQRQIKQFEENKLKFNYMNPEERKINSPMYKRQNLHDIPLLPGVAYDHQAQRQQRLLQKFLRGSRQSSRQNNYASLGSR